MTCIAETRQTKWVAETIPGRRPLTHRLLEAFSSLEA